MQTFVGNLTISNVKGPSSPKLQYWTACVFESVQLLKGLCHKMEQHWDTCTVSNRVNETNTQVCFVIWVYLYIMLIISVKDNMGCPARTFALCNLNHYWNTPRCISNSVSRAPSIILVILCRN